MKDHRNEKTPPRPGRLRGGAGHRKNHGPTRLPRSKRHKEVVRSESRRTRPPMVDRSERSGPRPPPATGPVAGPILTRACPGTSGSTSNHRSCPSDRRTTGKPCSSSGPPWAILGTRTNSPAARTGGRGTGERGRLSGSRGRVERPDHDAGVLEHGLRRLPGPRQCEGSGGRRSAYDINSRSRRGIPRRQPSGGAPGSPAARRGSMTRSEGGLARRRGLGR